VLGVAIALEYIDFRHGVRDWRANHADLAVWHAEMAKRPSLAATQPQG